MHERKAHDAPKRFAGEVIIPARKRRHGRGFTPERAVPWGEILTGSALLDKFEGLQPAVVEDCGPLLGQVRVAPQRPKRRDGSRGMGRDALYAEVQLDANQRVAARGGVDEEFRARMTVERALTQGEFVHRGVHYRVAVAPTGAIRTIPDKGAVLKWADAATLAAAIACGAF